MFNKKVLMADEHIVAVAKKHNMYLMPPFKWILLAIFIFIIWEPLFWTDDYRSVAMTVCVVLWAISFLRRVLINSGAEFVLTDKRIIKQYGVFSRNYVDARLVKCGSAQVSQSWLGRLCDFGDVSITGGGVNMGMSYIAEPFEFSKMITREMEKNQKEFGMESQSREKV